MVEVEVDIEIEIKGDIEIDRGDRLSGGIWDIMSQIQAL